MFTRFFQSRLHWLNAMCLGVFPSPFKGGEAGFREALLRAAAAGSPCKANRGREAAGRGMGS
jgi:hypothetical protein